MSIASLLEELAAWAATRPDVVAVGLVGSHARGTARPDSDVDVVILCRSPDAMLEGDWPSLFGEVESQAVEDYGALKSVRVFYRNALEVEFGVADPDWARMPLDAGTKAVLADGAQIVFDPGHLLELARRAAVA